MVIQLTGTFSLVNSCVFINKIPTCSRNINGAKNKYLSPDVNEAFRNNDILAISETHFNVRSKCPDNFFLIGRSIPIKAQKPRGGTAIYINKSAPFKMKCLDMNLRDCVVAEIKDSNIILVVMYIPPNNSSYYSSDYFDNMKIIFDIFGSSSYSFYFVGDLNFRICNFRILFAASNQFL